MVGSRNEDPFLFGRGGLALIVRAFNTLDLKPPKPETLGRKAGTLNYFLNPEP